MDRLSAYQDAHQSLFPPLRTFSLFSTAKALLVVDSAVFADRGAAAELIDDAAEVLPVTVEDAACDTDMNVVMTGAGHFVEVQGTAEGAAFTRAQMDALLGLATEGIAQLVAAQREALSGAP